jgi:hypothetical protein
MSREGGLGGVEIEAYIEARGTKLRAKTMNRTGLCLVCLRVGLFQNWQVDERAGLLLMGVPHTRQPLAMIRIRIAKALDIKLTSSAHWQ